MQKNTFKVLKKIIKMYSLINLSNKEIFSLVSESSGFRVFFISFFRYFCTQIIYIVSSEKNFSIFVFKFTHFKLFCLF
jgi:hypothetical protein